LIVLEMIIFSSSGPIYLDGERLVF
jgi:hypothetical protein